MHETSYIFNSTKVECLGNPSEKTWRKWRTSIPIHKEPSEIKLEAWYNGLFVPWIFGDSFQHHPHPPTTPPPPRVPYLQEPNIPFQDTSIETTKFGITQEIPTRERRNTTDQMRLGKVATSDLTLSPADLHKQHHPTIRIPFLHRLSVVRFLLGLPPTQRKRL